jgi:protein Mpv17
MKFISVLSLSSIFATSAFGVSSDQSVTRKAAMIKPTTFRKEVAAANSPIFRDPSAVRGGAVPGWAAYNEALDKKPLFAKACTSLVGWALGDILAQLFIVKSAIDWKRFITLSAFGFLWHGPTGHYFYNWIDSKIPGTSGKDVAIKVAIDQIIWCPIFMTVFFTYLGLVAGDPFSVIGDKLKKDLLAACQGSWKVWILVHAINFKFVSSKHRLIFINSIQIAFNMFLSMIGSKK